MSAWTRCLQRPAVAATLGGGAAGREARIAQAADRVGTLVRERGIQVQ